MASSHSTQKRALIVGGGFAGIRAALCLAAKRPNLKVTLISGKPHFEYYPTLYRIVTGYSALQACIPLTQIFAGSDVEVVEDYVTKIDLEKKTVTGGQSYGYDYLVLAPGSETGYFNIPGLAELSYGFKSTSEALKLRQHIHDVLTPSADATLPPEQKVISAHLIIVGGGPTGVELAGELGSYARKLAKLHGSDPNLVTIDLIEAAPRVMAAMPPDVSEKIKQRLHECGVNVYVSRTVVKQEVEELLMKDMTMKTRTVIWCAGVKTNRLIGQTEGLELDKRGRVVVDEHLQAKGHKDVFILGDAAATQYSGMAQTADDDGVYAADAILAHLAGRKIAAHVANRPIYATPVGERWASVLWGNTRFYGWFGWVLRELADLRYYMEILPPSKALAVFSKHGVISEDCPVCEGDAGSAIKPS